MICSVLSSDLFSSIRYEKAVIAMAKQKVTLEVLSYHAAAPREDALKLMVNWIFSCQLAHIEFFPQICLIVINTE